jgi:hypothetical protein
MSKELRLTVDMSLDSASLLASDIVTLADEARRLMRADTNEGRLADGAFGLIANAAKLLDSLLAAMAKKMA